MGFFGKPVWNTTATPLSVALAHHHGFFNLLEKNMKNAISWFEIPTTRLDKAQAFYEAILAHPMRQESMGSSEGAVFAYDEQSGGIGGALLMETTTPLSAQSGTIVYLDASPSLDAALERVQAAGGKIALPRQTLPDGLGVFAHIIDLDGNRIGLHAFV